MMRQSKTPFATLFIATLWTLGATNQASAIDLLDWMLGGSKVAASCGCSQKSGGHVQRCSSKCVAKHVQHTTSKVVSSHVPRAGNSKGGPVQRADKGGKKGGGNELSSTIADAKFKLSYAGMEIKSRMTDQIDVIKSKLASFCPRSSHYVCGKSNDLDAKGDADTASVTEPDLSIPVIVEADSTT